MAEHRRPQATPSGAGKPLAPFGLRAARTRLFCYGSSMVPGHHLCRRASHPDPRRLQHGLSDFCHGLLVDGRAAKLVSPDCRKSMAGMSFLFSTVKSTISEGLIAQKVGNNMDLRFLRPLLWTAISLVVVGGVAQPAQRDGTGPELPPPAHSEIDFGRDIQPILENNCYRCHGPADSRGGLRLHRRDLALEGGDHGPVIVPGSSADSRLIHLVGGLEQLRMPFQEEPLSDLQVGLLRAWIDQGAQWDPDNEAVGPNGRPNMHWAFLPVQRPPTPSSVESDWVRNPIDAFVLERQHARGIDPSPQADRSTLVRRLYLDLLGLPPPRGERRRFVSDDRPYAYERLVRRILASPHFGERWARHWLDLARYADSDGFEKDSVRPHAWRYRNWVIEAYNRDLPYDQFVIEQLAGDLLPDVSIEQRVATGFHRNTLTNREGGTDQEQFRVEQVVDRTNTTGQVFMGLTVGCAQCHSHKYDPITQREFYKLFAFFNTAEEQDIAAPLQGELDAYHSDLEVWEPEHRRLTTEAEAYRKKLRAELAEQADERLASWEADIKYRGLNWVPLEAHSFRSSRGATLEKQLDGGFLVTGKNPDDDIYAVVAKTSLTAITAFRLELRTDQSLPSGGPGRAVDGNVVLTEFEVEAAADGDEGDERELSLQRALSDYSQDGFEVSRAIDDDRGTGWAVGGPQGPNHPRQAIFILEESVGKGRGTTLSFDLQQRHGRRHNLGGFRISATTENVEDLDQVFPVGIESILSAEPGLRSDSDKARLIDFYIERNGRMRELLAAVRGHYTAKPQFPATMAQAILENPDPPETHIHLRGNFMRKGEGVEAGTLAVLPPFRTRGASPDRLDLARWLMDPSHPLTARVEVNRIWERLFGIGLVETSEDFGTRGEKPSHPELLDWLASEFVRRGWSRKEIIGLIVTSSTYQQASRVRKELVALDPKNTLLARQNRFRVESEITRDLSLATSGLLDRRIGGPGIRPPLPGDVAGLGYADSVSWSESAGGDRYRRGLYVFFQRTVPYPMLMTFDSPDSNTACIRRTRSNTPLQALTLLNDPVFVESAQAFGKRIIEEGPEDGSGRIRYAFETALGRTPNQREELLLAQLLDDQQRLFGNDPTSAETFAGSHRPAGVSPGEAATWVAVARMVMNLDEFVTRE